MTHRIQDRRDTSRNMAPGVSSGVSPGTRAGGFYGWTVVAAAFAVAVFGWGVGFYGPPIFLKAVRDARGWSVGLVSGAMTVHFLMGAFAVANLPLAYRRFGLPRVTVAGAASLAVGVVGWALAAEPWQLFAATVLSGIGWVALGAAGINAMVSPWFNRRRPAALSMAYNGASMGGTIFSPLWVAAILWVGFPGAAIGIAATMLCCVLFLSARVLGRTPESMGTVPDGEAVGTSSIGPASPPPQAPVGSLWRDRAFLTLALGMAVGLFAQIGLIAHLFSMLVPALGAGGAGLAAGCSTAAAVLGRTLAGWFLPADADRRVVAALNYGVQIAGCGAFLLASGTNVPLLLAGTVLFGLGIGNTTSIPPLIAQAEFTREDASWAVAKATAVSQALYALAPAVFGAIRDAAGGEAVPWLFVVAAGCQAAAAAVYLSGRRVWRTRGAPV